MILSIVDRGADIAYCSLAALRRADATSHNSCGRGGGLAPTHSTTTPQCTTALPQSCSDGVHDGLMHAPCGHSDDSDSRRPAHSTRHCTVHSDCWSAGGSAAADTA